MTLYSERLGHGPEMVFVHGWGLHGGIWGGLPTRLAEQFAVTCLDLPGHGRSRAAPGRTLDDLADAVAECAPGAATWIGWSLGGQVALRAAQRQPAKVARLVLVGTTPRFVQSPDWAHAMPAETFAGFARDLAADYRGTLLRFLSLQMNGDEHARALLKRLRAELFIHGEPAHAALHDGLAMLEHTDLRASLPGIDVPALVVHGRLDRLAPPAAGRYLAAHLPLAQWDEFEHSGHAPFLSQPLRFETRLREFLG
jgi:pimeloyl-[acyl-carrier protein] methyl ester esterase